MKHTLLLFCVSLLLTLSLHAQVIDTHMKPVAGVDYSRLNRMDSVIAEYMSKGQLSGIVTLVVKDNQVVQWKGYGSANAPMPKDAIFRIASQTKAITSVGILILYEQGKIYLDEPIGDFIPEFKNQTVLDKFNPADSSYTTVPAKRAITFRDLLTHSSGLDYADIGTPTATAIYAKAGITPGLYDFGASLLERMKALGRLPLLFQPGEKYRYGLNTDLLGCLIEVISGENLEAFFRKHIFQPLGMNDTGFNLPASKANRLAPVYTEDSLNQVIKWSPGFRHIDPNYPLLQKSYFSGGAGLCSTALDYAIFLQMLLNGGIYNGHRILSPRTVQLMTSNQLDFSINGSDGFGLGFGLTSAKSAARSPRNEGSFAWGGYFGTTYWADPKAHLVCLLLTQQTPNSHGDVFIKLEDVIYSSLTK